MSHPLSRFMDLQTAGDMRAAWGALRACLPYTEKLFDLQKLNRALEDKAEAWQQFTEGRTLRIAVLGSFTTRPIRDLLLPLCLAEGYWAEIYEGNYGSWETEPLDPESPLYAFKPDIVLVATHSADLERLPEPGAEDARVQALADQVMVGFKARWQAISSRSGARIIQHNFDLPATLPLGRLEGRYPWTASRFIQVLNDRFWQCEGREVRLLDFHQLSADLGRVRWFEPRWYHHSKHGFNPLLIRHYGNALAGLLRAMLGKTRKCLVTDLDNTLWGGIIGDDGLEGIQLGNNSATGEAHAAFGRYLKSLQQLGVVLAINSKNNADVALEVLDKHPETPLRRTDFAAIQCNWEPKSENLRAIAKQLNLGLDSLVFVDDNPAECEEVRASLPEVTVIEMSGDAAYFPSLIEELHLFTPLDFTAEDAARSQSYVSQQALIEASGDPGNLQAYLESLKMEVIIRPAGPGDLPRIEQLFRKTNQFNLTGRSYEQAQLEAMMNASESIVLAAWLRDHHANHGLVSTLVARVEGRCLILDNWVMSCRVFTRTLEQCFFAVLLEIAQAQGCDTMRAEFIATAKNSYVQPLFGKLGFTALSETSFELNLATVELPQSCIQRVESF